MKLISFVFSFRNEEKNLENLINRVDKAVKKNVLHKNNGANKKSKINKFVKATLTSK